MVNLLSHVRAIEQYNPIKDDSCVLYLPLWHPYLNGTRFLSADRYRHLATVTGAVHKPPEGRPFDGTDDIIGLGTSSLLYPTAITLIIWAKTNTAEAAPLFTWKALDNRPAFYISEAGATSRLYRGYHSASSTANNRIWNHSPVDLADGNWHMIMLTIPSKVAADISDCKLYADNMQEQTISSTSTGADVATQGTVQIGGADPDFKAVDVGEVILHSRVLTTGEGSHIYQRTKWRYQ